MWGQQPHEFFNSNYLFVKDLDSQEMEYKNKDYDDTLPQFLYFYTIYISALKRSDTTHITEYFIRTLLSNNHQTLFLLRNIDCCEFGK